MQSKRSSAPARSNGFTYTAQLCIRPGTEEVRSPCQWRSVAAGSSAAAPRAGALSAPRPGLRAQVEYMLSCFDRSGVRIENSDSKTGPTWKLRKGEKGAARRLCTCLRCARACARARPRTPLNHRRAVRGLSRSHKRCVAGQLGGAVHPGDQDLRLQDAQILAGGTPLLLCARGRAGPR